MSGLDKQNMDSIRLNYLLSEIRHNSPALQEQMLWAVLESLDDELKCGTRPAQAIKKEINILLAVLRDMLNRKGRRISVVEMKVE